MSLEETVGNLLTDCVVMSYSDEGIMSIPDIVDVIKKYFNEVEIVQQQHQRYIGTVIGGQHGSRVKEEKEKNTEYLIIGRF
jgi:adenine-specific DNA methylase